MWIHLLPLGLIDGAGGSEPPPPQPPAQQFGGGGGGGGRGLRELIDKLFREEVKPASILAEIVPPTATASRVEVVTEAIRSAISEARIANLQLARQVISELLKRHEELEEEETVVVSLLLM